MNKVSFRKLVNFYTNLASAFVFPIPRIPLNSDPWNDSKQNLSHLDQPIKDIRYEIGILQSTTPATVTDSLEKLKLEKDLVSLEKDRYIAQNNIYGILLQALTGLFFFVTAYFSWRTVEAGDQKQVTDRFSTAIEHLSSEQFTIQIGGIYELERIAKDSPKDHWVIVKTLAAFIREYSLTNSTSSSLAPSTQVALRVIGDRNFQYDCYGEKVDLSFSHFMDARLQESYFRNSILRHVNGQYSNFEKANLREANLEKADLRKANLEKADLRRAYLGDADITNAILDNAQLDELNSAHDLPVKKVYFSGSSLVKTQLTAALLTEADLSDTNLVEANFQLAQLYEANFLNSRLLGTDFRKADLSYADFSNANLKDAKFEGAIIYRANFTGASGLQPEEIKTAQSWKTATYDESFRRKLSQQT